MIFSEAQNKFVTTLSILYDADEAKELFALALEHVAGIKKNSWHTVRNNVLPVKDETSLRQILDELSTGKPLQYVLGETIFYGLKIKVSPAVLIPRPETEELVDWVIKEAKQLKGQIKVLDIGTGSGCIAISIKKTLPGATVNGLDVSNVALELALRNAVHNKTEVNFIQGDILSNMNSLGSFDIIVSNPPYIKLSEKAAMHQNVLAHEPHLALFVPDEDAFLFYRRIADFAISHLKPNGMLFFEINENSGAEIIDLLKDKGFKNIELKQDMQGKDRMVFCHFDEGRIYNP